MNTKRYTASVIVLVMVSMVLAGCASPTPASTPALCPTSAPLSCPTALAQVPPAPNDYRIRFSNEYANVVITFDSGDKCSMDVRRAVSEPTWAYEIVVNDDTYQNYVVTAMTIDEGKTLQDLLDYSKTDTSHTPPPWSQLQTIDLVEPFSRTFHGFNITGKPVYFACLVQGPGDQKGIGTFGPVQLVP